MGSKQINSLKKKKKKTQQKQHVHAQRRKETVD